MSFIRQHKGAVVWSLALHVAVAAAVAHRYPVAVSGRACRCATAPIQGIIVDQAAIEREQQRARKPRAQERQQQQREERQRREAAEQQRRREQREEQRVAAEQRARDEAQRKEAERVAAEKAEQERARAARRESEREGRTGAARARGGRRASARPSSAAGSSRPRRSSKRSSRLEAEANAARAAGLLDQYIRMIENRIKRQLESPVVGAAGLDCVVDVVQLPSGDVMSATVASCNGDEAVRRSIERAVMDASPLPKPPNPALFERNLNVSFQPEE